jgi:deoxyribodipyrimidine photo-lyase
MRIHWHRRDLRTADNLGLRAAVDDARSDPDDRGVMPVFVLDPDVLAHGSPPRVAFMLDALRSLRRWYRDRDGDLVVRHGDPCEVLPELAEESDAAGVTWGKDYSGLARRRDASVRQALDDVGCERRSVHDAVVHEPGSITTNNGDPYAVFSYYGDKWLERSKPEPVAEPAASDLHGVSDERPLPTLADLGFDEPEAVLGPASQAAARHRLQTFCAGDIYRYDELRDVPAAECTSRLSPHLKWGTIGVRAVYDGTVAAMTAIADTGPERSVDRSPAECRASVRSFRSQLAWREFYTQVLFYNPEVVTRNYRDYEAPIEWRTDPEGLQAWRDGETGYPIVDAGMRQLRAEGFVHNRLRMIAASFLTKDLLVDWRRGYEWFREKLVDHDTAADNGGWQWAASTGTDAQPYFRVFNPTTQGERYDPDAEYVTAYVPELRDVDPATIHSWPSLEPDERDRVAPDYPAPIVDHATRREAALETFERARGGD